MNLPNVKRTLRHYLGKHWVRTLWCVAVLVFWPLAVFWDDVAFSPPAFVEEWIKMAVGGIVLVVAVEVLRHLARVSEDRQNVTSMIEVDLPARLRELLLRVSDAASGCAADKVERSRLAGALKTSWGELRRELEDLQGAHASEIPEWLSRGISDFDQARVEALIRGLAPGRQTSTEIVQSEFEELQKKLTSLIDCVAANDGKWLRGGR